MGHHHAKAAIASGAFIVGIVDRDLQAARSLATAIGCANATTDFADALNRGGAVVAHVCTPASSHLEVALAVASAGLHALIEKPLGLTAYDVRCIHDCFEQGPAKRYACPTHQYAFQRSLSAAESALPRLGRLKHIAFDVCSAGAVSGRISPDEMVAEVLPHLLAVLQRLLPGSTLAALDWTLVRAGEGEWGIASSFGQCLVTMSLSSCGRPTRFLTMVTGERGTVKIDHFHDFAVLMPGHVSKMQKIIAPFSRSSREFLAAGRNLLARAARREFAYPGLQRLTGLFYDAIRLSSAPPITAQQSIDVAVARDAILALAQHG